jgi:TRAP-type mannitol/chloroaromatic compound transport system permease small subunit
MNSTLKLLGKFIDLVGLFCSLLMILMVLNVFYDVVMRYFFNDVSIGMQELEWHLFAAMFMLGIGYTFKEDGHVRVDIFYEAMTQKSQLIINILGALFFATPITLIILYFGWGYTLEAYTIGEGSPDPGGLPNRWIIRSVIPLSSIFLLLCIIYVTANNLIALKNTDDKANGATS